MNLGWINIARGAKVVALLAFLLPWLVVSCQGSEITSATGFDMVRGDVGGPEGQGRSASTGWALIGFLLIIGGLVATFVIKEAKKAGFAAMAASAAALVIIFGGMNLSIADARKQLGGGGGSGMEASMQAAVSGAIRFETRFGYWLTLIALLGAAGSGYMVWRGRPGPQIPVRVETDGPSA